mgnify:CR=1 FL=1
MRKLIKPFALLALLGTGGFLTVTACLYLYLSPKLPSVEELKEIELQIPLRIYSQDLKVIAEFGEKKRSPVSFDEIPQPMIDAFLAAEDDSFFEHRGIVISGLARAAMELITTGSIRSGGSTITMQVARNFFLSKRQEFTRKFNEILLSLEIERQLKILPTADVAGVAWRDYGEIILVASLEEAVKEAKELRRKMRSASGRIGDSNLRKLHRKQTTKLLESVLSAEGPVYPRAEE